MYTELQLITSLQQNGWIKTSSIIDAFEAIHRNDFVPQEVRAEAFVNTALPIGWGQTISQPLTVAFMLELLQPEPGNKILEIGFGSGWQTCLLAHIVGSRGKVYAFELVPELCEFGMRNIAKYHYLEKGIVECFCRNAIEGLQAQAPFDRIIAAAGTRGTIPHAWRDQLNVGGRIVAPREHSIWLLVKKSETQWEEKEFPGFVFVPLV